MQVECVTLDSSDEDAGEEVTAQPKKNKRRRISSSEEEDAASTSGKSPAVQLYRIEARKFIKLN